MRLNVRSYSMLAVAVLGCDGDPASSPDPAQLRIADAAGSIRSCETLRLSAILTGVAFGEDATVSWTSRNPELATVDETGLVTPVELADGTVRIVARANAFPAAADSVDIEIEPVAAAAPATISIRRITHGADSVDIEIDDVSGVIDVALKAEGFNIVPPCTLPVNSLERIELQIDGETVATRDVDPLDVNVEFVIAIDTGELVAGMPRWPDGGHELQAAAVLADGQRTVTPKVTLTFHNF